MGEALKETGKGLIAFVNILMVLVFFQSFHNSGDYEDLIYGVFFGFTFYLFGNLFIIIGKDLEKLEDN